MPALTILLLSCSFIFIPALPAVIVTFTAIIYGLLLVSADLWIFRHYIVRIDWWFLAVCTLYYMFYICSTLFDRCKNELLFGVSTSHGIIEVLNEETKMNSTEPFEIVMSGLLSGWSLMIIIGIFIAILPMILFFKVWDMTNDVRRIMELIEARLEHDAKKEGLYITPLNTLEQKESIEVKQVREKSEFWRIDKAPFKRDDAEK
ncbi:MAG TPA: hypothetical protein PKD28_02620 [Candidatus Saccharibacteria bacterium]|nr:hypothetical protein [Candidatus Saccharibacteria bacterium]